MTETRRSSSASALDGVAPNGHWKEIAKLALGALITLICFLAVTFGFARISALEGKSHEVEKRVERMDQKLDDVKASTERIERKLEERK